jgi:hypothetical protein
MAKTKPFASLHLSILHIFHMVLTASSRISLTNQNVFRAPSLRWRKGFPARSRKFPAPPNRENFGSTLKALRNLWVYFRKLPEKISNTLQISLRAGNSSPRSVRGGLRRQPRILGIPDRLPSWRKDPQFPRNSSAGPICWRAGPSADEGRARPRSLRRAIMARPAQAHAHNHEPATAHRLGRN